MARRLDPLIDPELIPGPQATTREDLRRFIRNEAWGHHACGTARIGAANDPMAVLGSDFRVRGTRGLWVVDATASAAPCTSTNMWRDQPGRGSWHLQPRATGHVHDRREASGLPSLAHSSE
ncbi:GMC oxidoreductase [Streptomyces sp. NPDC055144]